MYNNNILGPETSRVIFKGEWSYTSRTKNKGTAMVGIGIINKDSSSRSLKAFSPFLYHSCGNLTYMPGPL